MEDDAKEGGEGGSPELFISTAKTKVGATTKAKPTLVSLVDLPVEFSDNDGIDLDDDNDEFIRNLLQNSQDRNNEKDLDDEKEKEDPMEVDEIEDVPDLEVLTKSSEAKAPINSKKRKERDTKSIKEEGRVDDIEEDSDQVEVVKARKKRRTSDDLLKKSLESMINEADFEDSKESNEKKDKEAEGPIDLVDSSNSDFQPTGAKKKSEVSIRQKAKNTLDKYRLQGGKVKELDPIGDDEDEEGDGGKKGRKGRKRKRLEDAYSDQEDEEEIVYKPAQAKTKLKLNKGQVGPKFDISEKGDANVGDLILSPEDFVPVVKIPAVVNAKLRQYQRDGAKFLYKNYHSNQGAILGDEMGLGKTIQAVVFLLAVIPPKAINPFAASSTSTETPSTDLPIPDHQKRPVLVCAPASVVQNWEREIATWSRLAGRTLRTISYVGDKRKVHLPAIEAGTVNIVLTTYETFRIDFMEGVFKAVEWNCCVFDEIHKIKGRKAKVTIAANAINTRRRFGLTGTVMQNNFEELFTLLDFVRNGQRRDASPREIADAKVATKHLNGTIKKIVLRRDKSVITDLLKGKDDHVVFCEMTPLQINVYRRVLESEEYRILASVQEPCKCGSGYKSIKCCLSEDRSSFNWRKKIFPAIQNLQKLSQHPMLLHPKHENDGEMDPQEVKEREAFLERAFGEDKEAIEGLMASGKDELLSGKIRTLLQLLPIWQEKGHKALLFSYSTRTLDILQRIIRKRGYTFSRIDGSVPASQRQGIIDKFNDADNVEQFLMLISTKAGGLGLNITSANIVVVFDASWNVTHDLQAQDRAYRIGQTKHTDVYRLISLGSIEELIYQRQVYKQQMANIGVNGYDERRYFKGVHGVKGEEGELFGLTNLLALNTEKILSKEIVDRAELEETTYRVEKSLLVEKDEKDSEMSGIFDKDNGALRPLDKPSASTQVIDLDNPNPPPFIKPIKLGGTDEFNEILLNSGVKYMHNNSKVIGHSTTEEHKAAQAEEQFRSEIEAKSQRDFGSPLSPEDVIPGRHLTQEQLIAIHEARLRTELSRHPQFSQPGLSRSQSASGLSSGQTRRLDSMNPRLQGWTLAGSFIPNSTPHFMNPFVQHLTQQQTSTQTLNTNNFGSGNLGAFTEYNLDRLTPNRAQLIDPTTGQSQSQAHTPSAPSNGNFYSKYIPAQYLSSTTNPKAVSDLVQRASQPPPVPIVSAVPKAIDPVIDLSHSGEVENPKTSALPSPIPSPKFDHLANIAPAAIVSADLHSAKSLADFNSVAYRTADLMALHASLNPSQPSMGRSQSSAMAPPSQPPPFQSTQSQPHPNINRGQSLNIDRNSAPRGPNTQNPPPQPPSKANIITIDDD